jgi:hypothetical protein
MRQFVSEETVAAGRTRCPLASAEGYVVAERPSTGLDGGGALGGRWVPVDTHGREIGAEARLELGADWLGQGLTAGGEPAQVLFEFGRNG